MDKIGILIYEAAQPMDVVGPWEVLSIWKAVLHAPIELLLAAERSGAVACDDGITLIPHADFSTCPDLDYLIVPGGRGRIKQVENEKVIAFIQAQAVRAKKILSVCTGMFFLAKAGLLKGKAATTYWRAIPELKALGIDVVEERLVKSGKVWTSGGISSGIDLALALIEEIAGKEAAGQVQLLFEYFPDQKLYSDAHTAQTIPPYHGASGPIPSQLPAYIERLVK